MLAFASMDGTISVCSAFYNPALLTKLVGHTKGVTGKLIIDLLRFRPNHTYHQISGGL